MERVRLFQVFIFLFFPFCLSGNVKEQIAREEAFLLKAETLEDKQKAYFHLACAYSEDQEMDKAFLCFLNALKNTPRNKAYSMAEDEEKLFNEAFSYYLSQSAADPFKTSLQLLEWYEKVGEQHPEHIQLNFLLSTAYANMGKYLHFFKNFYQAYPFLWDTYLSYKTQGVLYLRLSQRAQSPEERQAFQKEALHLLNCAVQKEPKDAGLYKILISFAKEEKNTSLEVSYLQKLVRAGAFIPRGDIFLYVKEAVAIDEYELAQEMIDHAKNLYQFSRALSAAQEYLDKHKNFDKLKNG